MKILITGSTGFVGKHLIEYFSNYCSELECIPLNQGSELYPDLRDLDALTKIIFKIEPDGVIHLAGQSYVPKSFENPRETFDINFFGTLNLLTALKECHFTGRVVFVGSSDCYGLVNETDLPITESQLLKPRSPYAVSKVAAESLCFQWSQTGPFEIIMTRPFNHIGVGQIEHFVIPNFAKQIIEIKLGRCNPILQVGDIDVTRDFTDVRDVVKAYRLLLERGLNGNTYNVCSGREISIRSILQKMMKLVGLDIKINQDKSRFRSSELRRMCGSYESLKKDTGWTPEISIETTLEDILNDLERRLST